MGRFPAGGFHVGAMSRYDLIDFEWRLIEPLSPTNRVACRASNDRRVLNDIFWVLRSGAPWRDLPERYGWRTTIVAGNRNGPGAGWSRRSRR
jgi:transposase